MFKKISLVISVISLILSLAQIVYAQGEEKKTPDDFDKRWNRAAELMEKGEYKEAISTYMILISSLEKGEVSGACWYNIACAYMHLKNEKSALLSLGYAIKDGFRKADQFQADEDLKPLHDKELFKHYIELLKQNDSKVLDNLNIVGLYQKYMSEPDNNATEQVEKMLKELYKYIDERIEQLKKESYKDIEEMIEKLRSQQLKNLKTSNYKAYLGILVEDVDEATQQFFRLPKTLVLLSIL